ncbi:class I SAM-dependent methyltransferase [Halopseudomonas sabulinigri]|uniref:Class I SAM-dependent methyltransferase n=1 Tax=Halopseudomonas sabulinigri TaxID=472181 RepID=A0ABP9ZL73_9GAMM
MNNRNIWQDYYAKALARPHAPRTAVAARLNHSGILTAIDCGCGTGSDIAYLAELGYQVHGFDINADAVSICRERFAKQQSIQISQASFDEFEYPDCGLLIANASLFFAKPVSFSRLWQSITQSLASGGVFAGDFMGVNDSWAEGYRSPITALTRQQVLALFEHYEVIEMHERDEPGSTLLGRSKHWHTYSVVAIKS